MQGLLASRPEGGFPDPAMGRSAAGVLGYIHQQLSFHMRAALGVPNGVEKEPFGAQEGLSSWLTDPDRI